MNATVKFFLTTIVVALVFGTIVLASTHALHEKALVVLLMLNSLGSCLGIAAFIRWLWRE